MIPDIINKLYEDRTISKDQHESLTPLKKDYSQKLGNFLVKGNYTTYSELEKFFTDNEEYLFELFDGWLLNNSKVADAIVWRGGDSTEQSNGKPSNYNSWHKDQKQELSKTFWKMLLDILTGLNDAPDCSVTTSGQDIVLSTELKPDVAWQYYINYVAHSLRVEIDRLVHWSILRYNPQQLAYFLDSKSLFEYSQSEDLYSIYKSHESLFSHGSATPGDPVRTYDYLDQEKLISITRWGTVGRILGWCRDQLNHFKSDNTQENYVKYWQYQGFPPVERIITGTHYNDVLQHFTAGCYGTTGFFRNILRTINVPVLLEERCGHAMPHFVYDSTHEFYLSHGDDPYNILYKHSTPKFIPLELLINKKKFDKWFNTDLPKETICNNIGRHALELAIEYIPNQILRIYCDDMKKEKTNAKGRMYNEIFRDHIPLYELEALGFWDRLKIKIDSSGGCETIDKEL